MASSQGARSGRSWAIQASVSADSNSTVSTACGSDLAHHACTQVAPPNAAECFRIDAKRKVARDRTVTLDGVAYEVDAALIGHSVTLRYDASRKPKDRSVEVLHQGKHVQHARPLDTYANCFVKRHHSLGETVVERPAPEPVPAGLSLRQLEDDEDARLF